MQTSFNHLQRFNHRLMTAPSGQCPRALARAPFGHAQESLVRSAAANRSSSVHRTHVARCIAFRFTRHIACRRARYESTFIPASSSSKATNSVNLTTTSDPVTLTVDAAPTLTLTTPTNNAVYQAGDNIAISVNASDSDGSIAKVDFYQGTTLLATVTSGSNGIFTTNWSNVAAGTYSLTATATDNLGATTTTPPINVTVNAPPSATWTAPADGATATAPANVTLTVNATDSDGSITKVDFYSGATLIGMVNNGQSGNSGSNYSFNWINIAGGSYTLSAVTTDNNGATVNAGSVTIIVNTPPTVTITSPANNSTQNAPANIVMTATASDIDGSISQVDFYSGSNLIGSVTTGQSGNAGSSYTFNWTSVASGSYVLTAVATDNLNASTTSQAVTVNVNAITAEAGIYYIHADHLGTPRAITRPSDNTVVWKWENSDPFGANQPNEDPTNTGTAFQYNLGFPGMYRDKETGTFQNWLRDYDPSTGRYVQSDPIGLLGGASTFAYANLNPLSFIDPTGELADKVILIGGGVLIGGAILMSPPGQDALRKGINALKDACVPGDKDPCKGLRDQLKDHERKLREYIANPTAADNKGFLAGALAKNDQNLYNTIYTSRIASLGKQIANFKKQLEECEAKNGS